MPFMGQNLSIKYHQVYRSLYNVEFLLLRSTKTSIVLIHGPSSSQHTHGKENFLEERSRIHRAAELNGYDTAFVDKTLLKHKNGRNTEGENITTRIRRSPEVQPAFLSHIDEFDSEHSEASWISRCVQKPFCRIKLCNLRDKVSTGKRSAIYQIRTN